MITHNVTYQLENSTYLTITMQYCDSHHVGMQRAKVRAGLAFQSIICSEFRSPLWVDARVSDLIKYYTCRNACNDEDRCYGDSDLLSNSDRKTCIEGFASISITIRKGSYVECRQIWVRTCKVRRLNWVVSRSGIVFLSNKEDVYA